MTLDVGAKLNSNEKKFSSQTIWSRGIMRSYCVFQSEKFRTDLFVMERVINLNTYQPKQALYRGFNIIKGNSTSVNVWRKHYIVCSWLILSLAYKYWISFLTLCLYKKFAPNAWLMINVSIHYLFRTWQNWHKLFPQKGI